MNKQEIENIATQIETLSNMLTLHGLSDRQMIAIHAGISALEQQLNGGWIPVSERLPEEKINPITHDYQTYQVTFKNDKATDIRYYSFGGGHWWHGFGCMDGYVTAWRENPESYTEAPHE